MSERGPKEFYPRSSLESVATQESRETLATLEEYVAQGFFLHGSKSPTETLEPRQARDVNAKRDNGNLIGVYATDLVEIALFMALKDVQGPERRWSSGYSGSNGTYKFHGKNTVLTPGYVHVLPPESFEEVTGQDGSVETIAFKPVSAVRIIEVKPDIMKLFPNVEIDLSNESRAPQID